MFTNTAPENVGIASKLLLQYLTDLERRKLSTHGIVAARGDEIFLEVYAEPYGKDKNHRMYSQTKSFVGLAICLLEEEGKLRFDDKIVDFFPEYQPQKIHPYFAAMTVDNMLNMQTCFSAGSDWFSARPADRVKNYFEQIPDRYPGTGYAYDSPGSFVLGSLAEKLSDMPLLDYLRGKCLDAIGFSSGAKMLKCPGGHSWSDSALLCTPRDMLAFIRLIGTGGMWEGKRILSERVIENLTKRRSDNDIDGMKKFSSFGYGFQVWHYSDDCIGANGMHDQVTLYSKSTDISFTVTSCNTGEVSRDVTVGRFIENVIANAAKEPLAVNKADAEALAKKIDEFSLPTADDIENTELEKKIDKKTYVCEKNPMKLEYFRVDFTKYGGTFTYKNAQGEKILRFGRESNILQAFPEEGYSDEIGSVPCEHHQYMCAASGGFCSENQFAIRVQVLDQYNGLLQINIGYNDNYAYIKMVKAAEHFLDEYNGAAVATAE